MGGQAFNKKLNETQTRNMIRVAATSASQRKQNIEAAVKDLYIVRLNILYCYVYIVMFIVLYV